MVVVGGGISGLATAWRLVQLLPERRDPPPVVVLEQRPRTGGALRRGVLHLPGIASGPTDLSLDVGAEALLARRPEALQLIAELGLEDDVVHPHVTRAAIASRGLLHPIPAGTVMGVPSDPQALSGLLTADEVARVESERGRSFVAVQDDVSVGEWVGERLGAAVVDRLVEPLLGGVYAGHAARLSLRATIPMLWPAAYEGRGLLDAVAGLVTPDPGPVFAGLRGGVSRLAEALRDQLTKAGVVVRTGACVQELERVDGAGWHLHLGPAGRGEVVPARAVVLAVPAPATSRLLAGAAPSASTALGGVQVASTALVTALLDDGALDGVTEGVTEGEVSGVLVPPVEERLVKAMTFSSRKWGWVREAAGGRDVLRLSVGRAGEVTALQRSDGDLCATALADAEGLLGRPLPPADVSVTRWGGALPQYGVGHLDLVDEVLAEVAEQPGLAVTGAVYRGVGVPACIAGADAAAARVVDHLG